MDYNLKPTKLLDWALIGVCTVIRSNTVYAFSSMEAEGKVWDPVKLAKHPNPTPVIYYWFHLHHLSFNNYVS